MKNVVNVCGTCNYCMSTIKDRLGFQGCSDCMKVHGSNAAEILLGLKDESEKIAKEFEFIFEGGYIGGKEITTGGLG